jgi:lysyl-tRNA synthetase class 2
MFNAMRSFFNDRGYLEVETPVLQPIPGGAAARPFITPPTCDMPLYMRIANELYLKRLIVGGFEGVYEFSKISVTKEWTEHTTQNLLYGNICSLQRLQLDDEICRRPLEYCAVAVNGTSEATFGEHKINFKAPYARVTMTDSIKHFTGFDISGKVKRNYLMQRKEWELMWMPQWVKEN